MYVGRCHSAAQRKSQMNENTLFGFRRVAACNLWIPELTARSSSDRAIVLDRTNDRATAYSRNLHFCAHITLKRASFMEHANCVSQSMCSRANAKSDLEIRPNLRDESALYKLLPPPSPSGLQDFKTTSKTGGGNKFNSFTSVCICLFVVCCLLFFHFACFHFISFRFVSFRFVSFRFVSFHISFCVVLFWVYKIWALGCFEMMFVHKGGHQDLRGAEGSPDEPASHHCCRLRPRYRGPQVCMGPTRGATLSGLVKKSIETFLC